MAAPEAMLMMLPPPPWSISAIARLRLSHTPRTLTRMTRS